MFLLKLLLSNDFAAVDLYPAVFVCLLFFQFNYTARTIIASLLVLIFLYTAASSRWLLFSVVLFLLLVFVLDV